MKKKHCKSAVTFILAAGLLLPVPVMMGCGNNESAGGSSSGAGATATTPPPPAAPAAAPSGGAGARQAQFAQQHPQLINQMRTHQ